MASRADPIIADLKENGVNTVFRYYASEFQIGLPEKRVSLAERNALFDRNIALGVVFEIGNDDFSQMTEASGRDDARFSLDFGQTVIRQPMGSAIYFGVGGDRWTAGEQAAVCDYFGAINAEFEAAGSPYKIGVFGSGTTCANLRQLGLAVFFWLPLSTSRSGTRDFYNTGQWTVYQNHRGLKVGGRYTDTNVVNPLTACIGTFNADGVVTDVGQDRNVFEERAFVSAETLDLHSGPDAGDEVVGRLKRRQNVHVLDIVDDWAQVDIDEDGRPDGYCSNRCLMGLDRMP